MGIMLLFFGLGKDAGAFGKMALQGYPMLEKRFFEFYNFKSWKLTTG